MMRSRVYNSFARFYLDHGLLKIKLFLCWLAALKGISNQQKIT